MQASDRLRALASLLENVNAGTIAVTDVHTPEQLLAHDQTLSVQLSAQIQLESLTDLGDQVTVSVPDEAAITTTPDGEAIELPLAVTIDAPESPSSSEQAATTAEPHVTDGGVAVSGAAAAASATPDSGGGDAREAAPDMATDTTERDESDSDDTPPYRDPDRLQTVYEQYETFPEMTEALGVDVTSQTVRHHMIKHGIHEPNEHPKPADASASDDPQEPVSDGPDGCDITAMGEATTDAGGDETAAEAATDTADESSPAAVSEADLPADIDLPSHLTVTDIVEAVAKAQTLYEVQRALRLDRSQARQLLRNLDVLEFVGGRVTTAADRQTGTDEIIERLRQGCA